MKLQTLIRTIVFLVGAPIGLAGLQFGGHSRARGKTMGHHIGLWSLLAAFAFTPGCTLPSTSRQWNGLVGPNLKPVYVKSHTNVGINIGIFIPFLGSTTLPKEINQLTQEIQSEKGDVVRMIETSKENYWYGFPPFTWILTPVITTVTADYEPAPDVLANDRAREEMKKAAKEKK